MTMLVERIKNLDVSDLHRSCQREPAPNSIGSEAYPSEAALKEWRFNELENTSSNRARSARIYQGKRKGMPRQDPFARWEEKEIVASHTLVLGVLEHLLTQSSQFYG